jgi:hypothetical protein
MTRDQAEDKVRKLLSQAEGTNFGPEAETAIAMAHEIMARYNIEEIVLHESQGKRENVDVRQVRVKATKFKDQRHALLNKLARLYRCRAIITGDFMTVLGYPHDIDATETMFASLAVQMFEAMLNEPQATQSQPWAENFCWGFVRRIVERLEAVNEKIEKEVAPEGSSTALVLIDRNQQVDSKVTEMFPDLTAARVKKIVYDPHAQNRGRAAADRANINDKDGLGGGSRGAVGREKRAITS